MLYPIQNDFRNKLDISGIWDFRTSTDGIDGTERRFNRLPESRPMAIPGSWKEKHEDLLTTLD
jgi:beta-glucuronidase